MQKKLNILQLCIKPPYPPVDGGTLAMNSVTQGLGAEGHRVSVLTVYSDKHPLSPEATDKGIKGVYIDLRPKIPGAVAAMLSGESYHVRRYRSRNFADTLVQTLRQETFDIIHIESIFLTDYLPLIRQHSNAPVVLRAHNVEHLIWQRAASTCRNPFKRRYLKHLALTLRAYELSHVAEYDAVVCITQNDANYFADHGCPAKKISVIPFGITPEPLEHIDPEPATLFHIGSMDWAPNIEGIDWLLNQVWPAIKAASPQARLYIAGRHMPERLLNLEADGVTVVGEVADAMYFIASKQINIVPLLNGSGLRVKIIEAMSAGKTVISTTIGAQGILCTDGVDILIADTPEQFAQQVKRCLDNPQFCQTIGHNAYNLVATQYDNRQLASRLANLYHTLLLKTQPDTQ
ncbi:MAG: glycosyltransferase [Bacteroidales bacterium]|nr:glycosyltransferase [Bacteroidales bacterium]